MRRTSCWKGLKEEANCVANSIHESLKLLAASTKTFSRPSNSHGFTPKNDPAD